MRFIGEVQFDFNIDADSQSDAKKKMKEIINHIEKTMENEFNDFAFNFEVNNSDLYRDEYGSIDKPKI